MNTPKAPQDSSTDLRDLILDAAQSFLKHPIDPASCRNMVRRQEAYKSLLSHSIQKVYIHFFEWQTSPHIPQTNMEAFLNEQFNTPPMIGCHRVLDVLNGLQNPFVKVQDNKIFNDTNIEKNTKFGATFNLVYDGLVLGEVEVVHVGNIKRFVLTEAQELALFDHIYPI